MCFFGQMVAVGERARRPAREAVALLFLTFSSLAFSGQGESENQLLRAAAQCIERRELATAAEIVRKVLAGDPNSFRAYNLLGIYQTQTGQYEEARRSFEKAIELDPKYAPAHVNMGKVQVALGLDAAALKEFQAAIAIAPNDPLALRTLGMIYGRQARFGLAAQYLGRAQELAPGDREISLALAEAQISSGKKAQARRLIAALAKAGQLGPKGRETLGLLWLDNGEPQDAVDLVHHDPALSAEFYKLGYEKAEAEFDAGRYPETRKILETSRNLQTPDAAFHDLLGSVYYAIDDPKKASDEFQESVRREPDDPEHYFKLGMLFLKHRTPDPAIYVYETALKSWPDLPRLWVGLGLSYYFASRLPAAEQALRKALDLDPQSPVASVVLGDLLEQEGRVGDALEVFRKAIQVHPDLYMAYYYYGKLASKQGHENSADAIEKLRKAINLNPSFPEAHYELGKALAQAGETSEAIQQLNKSLELNPEMAQSHYQLVLIYKKLDDPARASEQLRLFEETSKKGRAEDLIQRLQVQIEKP
jgi:tetratricopeptide (TPR) repeat protein